MHLREACSTQAGNPGGRGRRRLTRNARGGRSPFGARGAWGCTLRASNGAHCSGEARRDFAFLKSPDSPLFWRQCTVGWRLPWSSILSG